MGYLKALQLMVRAYKAAKGVMPKGLDLLKLKMRARQKAIDSKKVIEFPKDRITNPFKPRPEPYNKLINPKSDTGIKLGKVREGLKKRSEGIEKLIKKGDVKIGQAPKTTKVKEPVDPKLILQESEKQTLARMRKENKEAIKRFKEKMDKPRDGKATGGLANLSSVYDNNPTLQAQYPNKQDYLDLFSSTTTTTPQTQTYAQMTQQSPAGIPAVKPIVPIIPPQGDSENGGGGITSTKRNKNFDYETEAYGINPTGLSKDVFDYEYAAANANKGILETLKQFSPTYQFLKIGKQLKDRGQQAIKDFLARKEEEKRIREEQIAAAAELARRGTGAYITQDSFGGDYGQRAGGGSFSGRGASTDITAETGSS